MSLFVIISKGIKSLNDKIVQKGTNDIVPSSKNARNI